MLFSNFQEHFSDMRVRESEIEKNREEQTERNGETERETKR